MFGPMKEAVRGGRFSSDDEVIGAVQNWLKTQPKNFYPAGHAETGALKSRWITMKSNIGFVSVYLQ
jgi:hypothetical protein